MYNQKYYKLIGIDLSRETYVSIRDQTILVGNLEEGDGTTDAIIAE